MTAPNPELVAVTAAASLSAARTTGAVSASTTAGIVGLWRRVNPYDAVEVRKFVAAAGRLLIPAQRTVANAHVAAQQVQLQAMGINQPVTVTIPDNVRGKSVTFGKTPKVHAPEETTLQYQEPKDVPAADSVKDVTVSRDDADADQLMDRAAKTYRYQRSIGTSHDDANTAAEARIESLVDSNMILSARMASQQTLKLVSDKDSRVIGYRRIIHPELSKGGVCGMCIAAADRIYMIGKLQPLHDRCNCTVSPITKSHDPGLTLNQDDLDRLYAHAQDASPDERPTSAAALKRTRYQLVEHNELGPVLTAVKGEQVPYYSAEKPAPIPKPVESKADIAARQLPGLEKSLRDLRSRGLAEDSPQIQYHVKTIAKFKAALQSSAAA